ncbi:hypothetical protein [Kribbella sp. NPDC004536]|uniref:hypothetical protein n=1 Tax=Kribbella sp. NPDC004536 TaxID=3364106 RepID=UPI0036B40507
MSAPYSGVYGSTIRLSGAVSRTGTSTKLRGVAVYLQRSVHGRRQFHTLAGTHTNASGAFVFSVKQLSAYDYRAYFPGTSRYRPAFSSVRYPVTTRYIALDSIATVDAFSGELRATGHAYPHPASGSLVYLQRYISTSKTWTNVATGKTTSTGQVTISGVRPGSISAYRLVIGSQGAYGAGISTAKSFAHYVWRGAFAKPYHVTGAGQFTLPTAADNPRRDVFYVEQHGADSFLYITPDVTGCKQASSYASERVAATGPTTIYLNVPGQPNVADDLEAPADSHLSLITAADVSTNLPGLTHTFWSQALSTSIFGILSLLCAN